MTKYFVKSWWEVLHRYMRPQWMNALSTYIHNLFKWFRQEFDPILLLPAESYLRQWIDLHDKQWPQVWIKSLKIQSKFCYILYLFKFKNGWVADVYTGHFDPSKDTDKLDKLVDRLQQLSDNKHILKSNLTN